MRHTGHCSTIKIKLFVNVIFCFFSNFYCDKPKLKPWLTSIWTVVSSNPATNSSDRSIREVFSNP